MAPLSPLSRGSGIRRARSHESAAFTGKRRNQETPEAPSSTPFALDVNDHKLRAIAEHHNSDKASTGNTSTQEHRIGMSTSDQRSTSSGRTAQHLYKKVKEMLDNGRFTRKLCKRIWICLLPCYLVWFIGNLCVQKLRKKLLFGAELWKWSLLLGMLFWGYSIIDLATKSVLCLLCWIIKKFFKSEKNAVYFARGLRRSVNTVVFSGSVLLTWVFYFRGSSGIETPETDRKLHIATETFVSVFAGAVLWLVKTVLLLKWEKDAVYEKLGERILTAVYQSHFVSHVCREPMDFLQPTNYEDETTSESSQRNQSSALSLPSNNNTEDDHSKISKRWRKASNTLRNKKLGLRQLYKDSTMYDTKLRVKYFVALSKMSSREDDGTHYVLKQLRGITELNRKNLTQQNLEEYFVRTSGDKEDGRLLYQELKKFKEENQVSPSANLEKWMVKAHKNSLALGFTLSDAKGVVNILDNVLTYLFIFIVIMAWLLLTRIVSTKMIALIASPFIAVSFMIGETCKRIFEGIVFTFFIHPFDVGDPCTIDGTRLQVKRMAIMTTTFIKIETKEEILYPNSTLATKSIINHKGEPDPSECVELQLQPSCTTDQLSQPQEKTEG